MENPLPIDDPAPSPNPTEWLEPAEEFPILFGLLTARANAQQKLKDKEHEQQIRRRSRFLRTLTPSPLRGQNTGSTTMEPDSSIRDPEDFSFSPARRILPFPARNNLIPRKSKGSRRFAAAREEYDAVPTSTTGDDYDLTPVSTTADDEVRGHGQAPMSISPPPNPRISEPPRKRSRLEECLSRGMSRANSGHDHDLQSYLHQHENSTHRKSCPPQVQETKITTNGPECSSSSIPTLNLRDLLAAEEVKHDVWTGHEFRFQKRKYTRRPEMTTAASAAEDTDTDGEPRPFQCTQCDMKFKRSYHLTRHLTIHWREERFFCPACKRACFQRKDNLLAHMRKCCPPTPRPRNLEDNSLLRTQLSKKWIRTEDSPTSTSSSWGLSPSKFLDVDVEDETTSSPEESPYKINLDLVEISEVEVIPSGVEMESANFKDLRTPKSGIGDLTLPKTTLTIAASNMTTTTTALNLMVKKGRDEECNTTVFRNLNQVMKPGSGSKG